MTSLLYRKGALGSKPSRVLNANEFRVEIGLYNFGWERDTVRVKLSNYKTPRIV